MTEPLFQIGSPEDHPTFGRLAAIEARNARFRAALKKDPECRCDPTFTCGWCLSHLPPPRFTP